MTVSETTMNQPVQPLPAIQAVPMLSVRGLQKIYKVPGIDVEAVRDLSFDLAEGELVCLVGPSG